MKHIDLFAGIGGFSLAAERVGWETVAFCEVDEFCRRVIERRFNRVRWVSLPGHITGRETLGIEGESELMGLDPDWVVLENTFHRWRSWVPELRRKLWERGYSSVPFRVRAVEIGAPHRRGRCFLVAHADCQRLRQLSWWWRRQGGETAAELNFSWGIRAGEVGADDGVSEELDKCRRKALGNAVVPDCAELIFRGIEEVTRA